jgi:hypothetical protein
MISPQKIKYNNEELHVYLNNMNIILDVSFDTDSGAIATFLNRSAVSSESHDGRYNNTYAYKYDELFAPKFTIVKSDFSDFSQQEVRKVLKYLTSTDKPALLEVYYDENSNSPDFCAVGGWTEIETYKLANNRTIGIIATFTATTPYALSAVTETSISDKNDYKANITVDTDDSKPVYPQIILTQDKVIVEVEQITIDDMIPNVTYKAIVGNTTIYFRKTLTPQFTEYPYRPPYEWPVEETTKELTSEDTLKKNTIYHNTTNGKYYFLSPYTITYYDTEPTASTSYVKITNTNTNQTLMLTNNIKNEEIVIDCANRIIRSSSRTNRVFGDDFNWKWLALYDGSNNITVDGMCTVTLKWRTVKKVGEW